MLPVLLLALEAQLLICFFSALTCYDQLAPAFFLKCSAVLLPRRRLLTRFPFKNTARINSLFWIGASGCCVLVWDSGAWWFSRLAHVYAYVSLMIEKRLVLMTLHTGRFVSVLRHNLPCSTLRFLTPFCAKLGFLRPLWANLGFLRPFWVNLSFLVPFWANVRFVESMLRHCQLMGTTPQRRRPMAHWSRQDTYLGWYRRSPTRQTR